MSYFDGRLIISNLLLLDSGRVASIAIRITISISSSGHVGSGLLASLELEAVWARSCNIGKNQIDLIVTFSIKHEKL